VTKTKGKSPFQKFGVEIYAVAAATLLVFAWVLAGATMAEFGSWALWTWLTLGGAVLLAGASAKAHEVRTARAGR
jgi:uncharacterized membrane protein YdbT with pleckstrin-like domain